MSFLPLLRQAKYELSRQQDAEVENRQKGQDEEDEVLNRMRHELQIMLTDLNGWFGWRVSYPTAATQPLDVGMVTRMRDNFSAMIHFVLTDRPGNFARHIDIKLSSTDKGVTYIQSAGVEGFQKHFADWLARNERALPGC